MRQMLFRGSRSWRRLSECFVGQVIIIQGDICIFERLVGRETRGLFFCQFFLVIQFIFCLFSWFRKKLVLRLQEVEEGVEVVYVKCSSLEKVKLRLQIESEDVILELERAILAVVVLDKKQRYLERALEERRRQEEETQRELEAVQREVRSLGIEFFRLRYSYEEVFEVLEIFKRENKNLQGMIYFRVRELVWGYWE